ncbi:Receptor-like protein kinase FERONIA [Morus notabilis]|uniref:Receptor-like protein kinase FERONIA n=1 Tax=Morus notabilis TaxID=981085 RepID=W9RHU8_9ROSA|nr:receptor-like protein kinase FERONIA [Morus notabilis]EXB77674.1 Receptor-like protein kinase FERONIA [Morus notabilis]
MSFYLFFTLHILTYVIAGGQSDITLDCGSSGNGTRLGDTRSWAGDISSKFFPSEGENKKSIASSATFDDHTVTMEVPYTTARLSLSAFTYVIPVTPGPKFIRLYFLPARYENYNSSKAFFSVEADEYTLLSSFSVDLTAGALRRKDLMKEFCVTAFRSSLKIKFSPSSLIPDAFAFINGIEVVSMPTDLYYLKGAHDGITIVGEKSLYFLSNNTAALQMMYRVNIGGQFLSPNRDTGFFRSWEGKDDLYLTIPGSGLLPVETNYTKFNFTKIRNYIAPVEVYQTACTMGNDKEGNKKYNLTWEFPVDSEFYYMVRLHFCEILEEVNSTNNRNFGIFIANQIAEEYADVVEWTGGKYIPYFRDYIVSMYGGEKKLNLSVALQAHDAWLSAYADAILNGAEIFKLNDTKGNLAGPNPDPIPQDPSPSQQEEIEAKKSDRTTIIAILSGVVSGVVLLSVLGFFTLRQARKVKDSASREGTTRGSPSLPSDLCRYFSLAEIKAATNNFEDIFIIGVGGFGNVYKGYIDNGTNPVAIKRLKSESSQGAHEFKTEIEMLSHLRHRHLVSLIGYCNEDREMILVYDYMARGTLQGHLYNTENSPLMWKQRLEICIGAARGLHYLHTGAKYTIIHRDVKTTNILLDEKWVAKVSDFGLSKMGPTTMSKAHVSTVVKGSIGYLDPEYYRRQQLSEKSDVYSFGVVLCEVLCGRPPIMRNARKGEVSLSEWAQHCYHNRTLHQIIDRNLTGKIAPECLKKYSEIVVTCMHDNGTERPSMNDVVWGLEFAMQLQQNAEDNDGIGGAIMEANGEDEVAFFNNNNSSWDGTFTCSWEESLGLRSSGMTKISSSEQGSTTDESMKGMSGAVFSEIKDSKGR